MKVKALTMRIYLCDGCLRPEHYSSKTDELTEDDILDGESCDKCGARWACGKKEWVP